MENQQKRGRPRLSSPAIAERREQVYNAHLMGFSEAEISASLHIDKAAVHRHIQAVREARSWADKNGKQRFSDLLEWVLDGTLLTVKEAWRLYHAPDNVGNLMARVALLGRVQAGMSLLGKFIPGVEDIKFEEQIEEVQKQADSELAALRNDQEERKLAGRVLPMKQT